MSCRLRDAVEKDDARWDRIDFASLHEVKEKLPLRLAPVGLSRVHDCSKGESTAPPGAKLKMQKRPARPLESTLSGRQTLQQSTSVPALAATLPRPVSNFLLYHDKRQRDVEKQEMGPSAHGADALGKNNWHDLINGSSKVALPPNLHGQSSYRSAAWHQRQAYVERMGDETLREASRLDLLPDEDGRDAGGGHQRESHSAQSSRRRRNQVLALKPPPKEVAESAVEGFCEAGWSAVPRK
mmetsp:Transcript_51485/g.122440  ORF Transcript_51485/g.122440 Transcript_51485/m.122440 type:complete len:240 (+) Transcript_51485:92-811(+)